MSGTKTVGGLSVRWIVLLGVGLGLVVGSLPALAWALLSYGHARVEERLELGLTQDEVRARFGREPNYAYRAGSAPADYYVEGWARRERPITSSVWIYIEGEPICYVWFDADGRVEDWFVGGS